VCVDGALGCRIRMAWRSHPGKSHGEHRGIGCTALVFCTRAPPPQRTVYLRGSSQQHGRNRSRPSCSHAYRAHWHAQSARGHEQAHAHAQVTRAGMPASAHTQLTAPGSCGCDGVCTDAHAPPARASPCASGTVHCVACRTLHVGRCTIRRGCCAASCAVCRTVRRLHEPRTNRPHRNREMRRPAPASAEPRVLARRIRHVAGAG
jgi:hypothetical protein